MRRGVPGRLHLRVRRARPPTRYPNQLYIDPEECINCGVCEPECPWEAIFEDEQVPSVFHDDVALNARMLEAKDQFAVPEVGEKPKPTPEQIEENKAKWGYSS